MALPGGSGKQDSHLLLQVAQGRDSAGNPSCAAGRRSAPLAEDTHARSGPPIRRKLLGLGSLGEATEPRREYCLPVDADLPRAALVGEEDDVVMPLVDVLQ